MKDRTSSLEIEGETVLDGGSATSCKSRDDFPPSRPFEIERDVSREEKRPPAKTLARALFEKVGLGSSVHQAINFKDR